MYQNIPLEDVARDYLALILKSGYQSICQASLKTGHIDERLIEAKNMLLDKGLIRRPNASFLQEIEEEAFIPYKANI